MKTWISTSSDIPLRVRAHTAQGDSAAALVWFILKINTVVLSQISSVHSVKRRWTSMIDLIALLQGKRPIHIYHSSCIDRLKSALVARVWRTSKTNSSPRKWKLCPDLFPHVILNRLFVFSLNLEHKKFCQKKQNYNSWVNHSYDFE